MFQHLLVVALNQITNPLFCAHSVTVYTRFGYADVDLSQFPKQGGLLPKGTHEDNDNGEASL